MADTDRRRSDDARIDEILRHVEGRQSDSLIIEMHGMLSTVIAEFQAHVKLDEKLFSDNAIAVKEIRSDISPLQNFHGNMKTAGKIGLVIAMPALAGIGLALWKGIVYILSISGK